MPLPTNINWDGVQENQGGGMKGPEPGGYVVCVMGIHDVTDNSGSYLDVDFDIAEGPFKGYYAQNYKQFPDRWNGHIRLYYKGTVKRGERAGEAWEDYGRIKALKTTLEKSNNIQIQQFTEAVFEQLARQRKLFGVLMGYDQQKHKYLNAYQVRSVQAIREGDYEIPDEWKIHWDTPPAPAAPAAGAGYGGYGGASSSYGYGGNGYGAAPPPANGEPADDDGDLPFD